MQRPSETDFEVEVTEGGVHVIFKPTKTHINYTFLAAPQDIRRLGPLSADQHVRHSGPSGDTDDYRIDDVLEMARRVALKAVPPKPG